MNIDEYPRNHFWSCPIAEVVLFVVFDFVCSIQAERLAEKSVVSKMTRFVSSGA